MEQGVAQAESLSPSSVATAPLGLVTMATGCGALEERGAPRRGAFSGGARFLGVVRPGTSVTAGFSATAGGGVDCAVDCAAGMGLGLSPGVLGAGVPVTGAAGVDAAATGAGVEAGAVAGGGSSAATGFWSIPRLLISQLGFTCQAMMASTPAAMRTAARKGRKPLRCRRLVSVVPLAERSARRARRLGGRAGAVRAWSATVGAFRLPPRGRLTQPLLAAQAFSSASINS